MMLSHYIIYKFRMSQQKQVQISDYHSLKTKQPKIWLNCDQSERVLKSSSLPANLQFGTGFYEENGYKPKSGNELSIQCEVKEEEWTPEQENLLVQLHNKKGNKWVQIARQLKRNDNSTKNHYHAKLRRAWRKFNKLIADYHSVQQRPLRENLISKVVQTAEGLYTGKEGLQKEIALRAFDLKNKLLSYAQLNQQLITTQQLDLAKTLVADLLKFEKSFKNNFKDEVKAKAPSVRFKGKEIFMLLAERQKSLNCYKPYKCYRVNDQQKNRAGEKQKKKQTHNNTLKKQLKKPDIVIPSASKQNPINNTTEVRANPSIYYFDYGTGNYQSYYYPAYQKAIYLYSGQIPSFNFYDSQTSQMGQWKTFTGIEDFRYLPAQDLLIKAQVANGNSCIENQNVRENTGFKTQSFNNDCFKTQNFEEKGYFKAQIFQGDACLKSQNAEANVFIKTQNVEGNVCLKDQKVGRCYFAGENVENGYFQAQNAKGNFFFLDQNFRNGCFQIQNAGNGNFKIQNNVNGYCKAQPSGGNDYLF